MEGEGGGSPRAEQKEVGPPHKGRSLITKQKELEVEYLKQNSSAYDSSLDNIAITNFTVVSTMTQINGSENKGPAARGREKTMEDYA
ncbi:hypothetical protein COL940_006294 [Colletotrichum noveboracense]|nr:hypothetical protein COL940_006294 [Colletotrichum noveboracense]